MTAAPALFHVESPYVIRNLKDRLQKRKAEVMTWFLSADKPEDMYKIQGRIAELNETIATLDDLEKQERN